VRGSENCGVPEHRQTLATIEGTWRLRVDGQGGVIATIGAST
jgi:hypothetical protein